MVQEDYMEAQKICRIFQVLQFFFFFKQINIYSWLVWFQSTHLHQRIADLFSRSTLFTLKCTAVGRFSYVD